MGARAAEPPQNGGSRPGQSAEQAVRGAYSVDAADFANASWPPPRHGAVRPPHMRREL